MSTATLPRDDSLPQIAQLLDADAMAPVLARSLDAGADVDGVRVDYVGYDPGEAVLVQYEVTLGAISLEAVAAAHALQDLAALAAGPAADALRSKVGGRLPVPSPLRYDDGLGVLVHWPPLDPVLPALAEPPERLQALLEEAGIDAGEAMPVRVHYKPGRRAVFRFGDHLVKLYAREGNFKRSVENLRAAERLPIRTASCEAVVPDLRIQVQSLLPGTPAGTPDAVAGDAGRVLRLVHAAQTDGLRAAPPEYWLRSAASSAQLLAAVAPELEPGLERLLRRLEDTLPQGPLVCAHGDFHARQLLRVGDDTALVDFDRMSLAPPALDLATYVSFVREAGELPQAIAVLDALVAAYGERPPDIGWYLTGVLLRRARIPFRRLHDDWQEQLATRVGAAEAALEL